MVAVFSRFVAFTNRHPVVRGMISYGTLWPTSCLIQQTMVGKRIDNYDWMQVLRFSLYGGLFTAPTLYAWIRLSTRLWPGTTFKTSITKAVVEQLTYGPAALVCFFFGMSLLEGKSIQESKQAVEQKFIPTWKIGVCIWPVISTINFRYIPERNKVPFVGVCSLVWCIFMAYMHQLEMTDNKNLLLTKHVLQVFTVVGICFWPVLQTINFRYIPEKNRVPFVSACSLVWCCFLAYMHQLQLAKMREFNLTEQLLPANA